MFGITERNAQTNPIANAILNNMADIPKKTRFDEGVDIYWADGPCPQDPEGKRGWETAQREIEFGIDDEQ